MDDSAPEAVDVPDRSRFELTVDGHTAELVYLVEEQRLVLVHTGVPEALEGRGIGGALVEAALHRAARDGLTVVPRCPFARRWLRHHADRAARVRVDWEHDR